MPVLRDLQNELKDYAKDEKISTGSERYLSDGGKKGVSNPDRSVSQTEILMFMFHGEFCIMKFQTRAGAMMCMNRGIKATGN